MPVKVTILSDFAPEGLDTAGSPEVVQGVLESVMSAARMFWIQGAQSRLSSSRRDYVGGIQPVETGPGFAAVSLVGALPLMVEEGASPFDMHDTLLGPDVPVASGPGQRGKRVTKDGKFYRAIPFRHQTPGTEGQGGGAVMGSQFVGPQGLESERIIAQVLGESVYRKARTLKPSIAMPGQATQWGGRLREGLAPKLKPHHATDIFAGMVKMQKTYGKATQNTYQTFRMISDNVPDKWLHPGLPGIHLADEVSAYVERVAEEALAKAAEALL